MHDVPYFDRFARLYDLAMPETNANALEAGLSLAGGSVDRVVDLGGGTGRAARALDRDCVVADASVGMLAEARDRGLPVVRTDVRHLAVRDGCADAVTVVDALHHFPDRDAALAEAARALRPGGVVVVRDFDPATLRGRLLVAVERLVGFRSRFEGPDDLAARLGGAGLGARVLDRGFAYTVAGRKPGDG